MLKRTIVTETIIHAPVGEVWEVLANPEEFTASNSTFGMKSNELRPGGTAELVVDLGGRETVVKVKLREVTERSELRWYGGLPLIGGGTHFFKLEPRGEGKTHFMHGEEFTGPAMALAWPLVRRSILDRYQQTTDEIKDYCEQRRMA